MGILKVFGGIGRRAPAAGAAAAAVLLGAGLAHLCLGSDLLTVQRRDAVRFVTLSGELQAVEQLAVTAPRTESYVSAPIAFLAPEGSQVAAGDLLVQFDADAVESQLREAEVTLDNARVEVARKEAEQENQRQEQILARARAVKNRRVAEIYAALDAELMPRSEFDKYQFDLEKAIVEESKAERRLRTLEEAARSELEVARLDQQQAELQVQRLRQDLQRLSVAAPRSGMVIHGENFRTGNKVQVGDELYAGWPVVHLPDLNAFKVTAFCYDSDYHFLEVGRAVEVSLDAISGEVFPATITELSEVARTPSPRVVNSKMFEVEVRLGRSDPERMRPGMTARIRVPVPSPDALVVPRSALRTGPDGRASVVVAETKRNVDVKVLEAGVDWVAVEGDLRVGDRLQPADPAAAAADWIETSNTRLSITATATGTLQASRALQVSPPSIPFQSQFKIVAMAPEGALVSEGDPVVVFDSTEIDRRLQEDDDSLEKNRREVEKLEATQQLKVEQLEMELETAAVEVDRARARHGQAEQFQGLLERQQTQLELDFAVEHVAILEHRLAALKRQQSLQLQILREQRQLHLTRQQRHRRALDALTVRAPQTGGVVIYETNYRNEKKFVGAQAYRLEPILQLPDLSSLIVRAQIAEADAGRLRTGQLVKVQVEALPDEIYTGRVASLSALYRRPVYNRPAKVLDFEIEFKGPVDPQLRPGMAARVEVTTRQLTEGVTVPVKALASEGGRHWVWVRSEEGPVKRYVKVGEVSGPVAVILSGLQAGEQVARSHRLFSAGDLR